MITKYKWLSCLLLLLITAPAMTQLVLTPEKLIGLNRLSGGLLSQDESKVFYEVKQMNISANTGKNHYYILDRKTQVKSTLLTGATASYSFKWGKGNFLYYLSNESGTIQLWKIHADGSQKSQVSQVANAAIEDYILSDDESQVVFVVPVKAKLTKEDKYPDLPLANARIEENLMYRHWNQWSDDKQNHLFVFAISGGKTIGEGVDILKGEPFSATVAPFNDSDNITFSKDGKSIVYATKKKLGKDFAVSTDTQIYSYDIASQVTSTVSEGYLGYDLSPKFDATGARMAWISMAKDGFESGKSDLIIRDVKTKSDINITKDHDINVQAFQFTKDGKALILLVPIKGTTHLFEIEIKSRKLRRITTGKFNVVSFSIGKEYAIVQRQSMTEPTDLYELNLKSGKMLALTDVNVEMLEDVKMPTSEERWVKTHDGKDMLVWVVYPPNFDKTKKYPTLLYCQGGPQSMVSQSFSYRWNLALMASQGYIVVAPNRRGLPGFGQEWNDAISGDWGGNPIRDYLTAIDDVAKESYVDKENMGAVGASYGGYSVYYLAGCHENRFKTFISHCGLFNLESWYGTTEELFFANWENKGPYWLEENKEYYVKNSPHRYVKNWTASMMVIHGGMDFRVPESEGMQAFQAAQLLGLKSRYLYFPKEGHWITTPQNGVLWHREFFDWLDSELK